MNSIFEEINKITYLEISKKINSRIERIINSGIYFEPPLPQG